MGIGNDNLIPFNERTEGEQRKIAQKGGIASGKARRRKRTMREAAQLILKAPANAEQTELLKNFGFDEQDCTNLMAIMIKAAQMAVNGNLKAAEFIRDTSGESPKYQLEEKRLENLIIEKNDSNSMADDWIKAVMSADEAEVNANTG